MVTELCSSIGVAVPQGLLSFRDQCQQAKVPFFFKQWGGVRKKKRGRELEGRTWDEMPISPQFGYNARTV